MIPLGIKWDWKKKISILTYHSLQYGIFQSDKTGQHNVTTKIPFPHLYLRATPYQDDCVTLEVPSLRPTRGQFLFLLPVVCRIDNHEPRKRHLAVRLSSPVWTVI